MKRRYAAQMLLGLALAAAGMSLPVVIPAAAAFSVLPIVVGAVLVATAAMRHWRYGEEPEGDERTKKIGAYGITYSWMLTLILLFLLFWIDYLGLAALPVRDVLLITILVMAVSARLFQWHLFRKGDVS
ncbi:MAG: hypothetical protein PHV57_07945 [Methanomicrobiaceae archaeon]|nr:hypothetical protein [Methanomicrobiaceae archaeon]